MIPTSFDLKKTPHKPGIYIYKDSMGKILYVGKAIDLYHRIASYFTGSHDAKTTQLVSEIRDLEIIIVESELEALILEANLIKKYLPSFNIKLTDDKDYLYIKITKEEFPQILVARKQDLKDAKEYFGPFPSGRTVRTTLKKLRKIFPWCSSPPMRLLRSARNDTRTERSRSVIARSRTTKQSSPCFYFHLHLCPGPCAGKITKEEYNKIIKLFSKFMQGKSKVIIKDLEKEMKLNIEKLEFEKAEQTKKTISGLRYLLQTNNVAVYLENPNFMEDQTKKALIDLKTALNLDKIPERIECYDISNISGMLATGSMVVLIDGEVDKKWYRRFKIKATGVPNDVGMMREILQRRMKHDEWPKPDLILVDGGKGQVGAVAGETKKFGWEVSVFGLAKKMEWVVSENYLIIKLPRASLALKLLQKIRDEAHRFAIAYHRKLRTNSFVV